MKLDNITKAKVLAQYMIYFADHISGPALCGVIARLLNGETLKYRIHLKSVDEITDEDAAEVARLNGWFTNQIKDVAVDFTWVDGFDMCVTHSNFKISDNYEPVGLFACQYLQSKGYDIPQLLLGNKTLQEVNLAYYN